MTKAIRAFKRGPMTDAERSEIDHLAGLVANPSSRRIANKLNRHPGTVFWYMLNKGFLTRTLRYNMQPYRRGDRMVYPYTREEDLRLLELRREGKNPRQIAEIVNAEFGRSHSGHSADVRLKFLAAYENPPDEMAAAE